MENNIQSPIGDALPPPKKTMTEAALAANRVNASKSTGPRTPIGKLKAASNSLKHSIYSLRAFENYVQCDELSLQIASNIVAHFEPITTIEHMLTHQLINFELRFFQMEALYNRAVVGHPDNIIANPPKFLTVLIRELNSLPNRIQRTIKALQLEKSRRVADALANIENANNENYEIEAIPDEQPLPEIPRKPTEPQDSKPANPDLNLLYKLFAGRILSKYPEHAHLVPRQAAEIEMEETNPSAPAPPPDSNPEQDSSGQPTTNRP